MDNDPSLAYPFKQETVPGGTLLISVTVLIGTTCMIHIIRNDNKPGRVIGAAKAEAKAFFLAFSNAHANCLRCCTVLHPPFT